MPENLSLWLRDPAKIVFRIVSTAMVAAGVVGGLLVQYADLVPEKYRATTTTVLGICTTVGVIGTKITTFLIAHGYGPKTNGKNGAWAPAAAEAAIAHAQTMRVRKGDHDGATLPGAPANAPGPVENFGVLL